MDEYSTRNINVAAFIYLNEVLLLSAVDERGFECFVFDDKGGVARNLAAEFQTDATVPARTYSVALSHLRKEATTARRNRQ